MQDGPTPFNQLISKNYNSAKADCSSLPNRKANSASAESQHAISFFSSFSLGRSKGRRVEELVTVVLPIFLVVRWTGERTGATPTNPKDQLPPPPTRLLAERSGGRRREGRAIPILDNEKEHKKREREKRRRKAPSKKKSGQPCTRSSQIRAVFKRKKRVVKQFEFSIYLEPPPTKKR